jgi:hypothetical protein
VAQRKGGFSSHLTLECEFGWVGDAVSLKVLGRLQLALPGVSMGREGAEMATNPMEFFLNSSESAKQGAVVDAPAFSLTKVLSAGAIVVTPIATLVVDKVSNLNFSTGQVVALGLGVLAFLAVTASADVLARAWATSATGKPSALIRFDSPISGHHVKPGADTSIEVLAASGTDQPYFLVREGNKLTWLPDAQVRIF